MNKPELVTSSMQKRAATSYNKQRSRHSPYLLRASAHPPHTNTRFFPLCSNNYAAPGARTQSGGGGEGGMREGPPASLWKTEDGKETPKCPQNPSLRDFLSSLILQTGLKSGAQMNRIFHACQLSGKYLHTNHMHPHGRPSRKSRLAWTTNAGINKSTLASGG